VDDDWPSYRLTYADDQGTQQSMDLPMTFADFAVTEGRFRKHFRKAPPETWNDDMTPLHEFLEQEADDREGLYPYIWGVDGRNRLMRVMVSEQLVRASEDRLNYWRLLKSLTGVDRVVDEDAIADQARAEMAQKLSASLLSLVTSGDTASLLDSTGAGPAAGAGSTAAPGGDYEPVWIDTPECQSCDECTKINTKIFAYNDDKKAIIVNPRGGSYKDIVRAAEKCTAECIHPGTPFNANEKGLDKLVKRAEKFQ
jgi:pyruvate-ferredoxin/flavodoxin oxidoreductase